MVTGVTNESNTFVTVMRKWILAASVAIVATACTQTKNTEMDIQNIQLINIEEHFTDQRILDAMAEFTSKLPAPTGKYKEIADFFQGHTLVGDALLDVENIRLPHMDSLGVGMQILSYPTPISDVIPAEEAVKISRQANDILAEIVSEHPDRFRAMALLPMADPEAAALELERTVKELGLVGAMLYGQYKGRFYDEPEFFPIFEKAAELDVPVSFHPAYINQSVMEHYYMSDSFSPIVGAELSSAMFGWHLDVGIHVVRMVLSGIFDKLPDLKIISGHWGENIPFFFDRMDYMQNMVDTGLKKKISEYYRDNVYITPSGIVSENDMDYILKVFGAEHIIWSEDYPYIKTSDIRFFLDNSDLTDEQKYMIARGNAEKLYKIAK